MKTGKAVSVRIQARWRNFATQGKPLGRDGEPEWLPYQAADRPCLVIDRQDTGVNDVDLHIRSVWGSEVLGFR
jgi:para-nitrobenzyl esterase